MIEEYVLTALMLLIVNEAHKCPRQLEGFCICLEASFLPMLEPIVQQKVPASREL